MDEFFNNIPQGDAPKPNEAQNHTNPVYQQPVQPTQQVNPYYQIPNGYYAQPQPVVKPKKKNRALGVIIIVAIACVGLAIIGIFVAASQYANNTNSGSSIIEQFEEKNEEKNEDVEADVDVKDSASAAKRDADGNLTVAGVTEKCINSCVLVSVYSNQSAYNYFYGYGYNMEEGRSSGDATLAGEGSGVIMSEKNGKTYIITCAHVISGGDSFKITLENGDVLDADMVNYDSQTDIGVLSVNKTGLKVATFGKKSQIEVGEQVVAIGCPGGSKFKNSVTSGYVSALDRPIASTIGYNTECIQVDAAINPGNSGGALFNMQGQVIGIISSKIASTDYEGMGFAIPSDTAIKIAKSLISNGYVAGRAKLGIEYSAITNFSNASAILSALNEKGFENAQGTMIIRTVDDKSDLKNKNIKEYDMIVAVDGKTMTSTDVMTSTLSAKKPGDTVKLTIARIENNNKIKTFEISCKLIESKE